MSCVLKVIQIFSHKRLDYLSTHLQDLVNVLLKRLMFLNNSDTVFLCRKSIFALHNPVWECQKGLKLCFLHVFWASTVSVNVKRGYLRTSRTKRNIVLLFAMEINAHIQWKKYWTSFPFLSFMIWGEELMCSREVFKAYSLQIL